MMTPYTVWYGGLGAIQSYSVSRTTALDGWHDWYRALYEGAW